MKKLPPYKAIHRTTIDQVSEIGVSGVYVIAYMGRIMYVGKTTNNISKRLCEHIYTPSDLGSWLFSVIDDWRNVRIDIIEPKDHDDSQWLSKSENACIKRFAPKFNKQLMPESVRTNALDSLYYQKRTNAIQLELPI